MNNLKYYLNRAQKENWAIGQFNFSTLEQFKGILGAAKKLNSPLILGASEGESKFSGLEEAVAMLKFYRKKLKLPIFLNLDHGKSFSYIKKAVNAGYDAVHFDGSKLPLKENTRITREVVNYAKRFGVLVEGEVGAIGTDSSRPYKEKFKIKEEDLTDPDDAREFVEKTKVDSLAISIGNFHGIEVSGSNPRLRLERLKKIKEKTGNNFLVLHGGSGIPEKDVRKAIKLGIVKVNINTELRMAYTDALKRMFKKKPDEVTPYKYMPEAIAAVQKIVEDKIKLFKSNNKAQI